MKPTSIIQDERPQCGGWAPGRYYCQCRTCKEGFIGQKLSTCCANCAYAAAPKPCSAKALMPEVIPRRPLDDSKPDGYLESLNDWFNNNKEAVEWFLENAESLRSLLHNRKEPHV